MLKLLVSCTMYVFAVYVHLISIDCYPTFHAMFFCKYLLYFLPLGCLANGRDKMHFDADYEQDTGYSETRDYGD